MRYFILLGRANFYGILQCARHYAGCLTCIISFNSDSSWMMLLLFQLPFYKWEYWNLGRLSNISKSGKYGVEFTTGFVNSRNLTFNNYMFPHHKTQFSICRYYDEMTSRILFWPTYNLLLKMYGQLNLFVFLW